MLTDDETGNDWREISESDPLIMEAGTHWMSNVDRKETDRLFVAPARDRPTWIVCREGSKTYARRI